MHNGRSSHPANAGVDSLTEPSPLLQIGALAKRLGTSSKTLRHYEAQGLLRPSSRSASGYRQYDAQSCRDAQQVLALRQIGFSIPEIRQVLADPGRARESLLSLLDQRLRKWDLELAVMQGGRDDLEARYQALVMTPRNRPCRCICDALQSSCNCPVGSN